MNEADFLARIQNRQSLIANLPPHPGRYPRPVRTLGDDLVGQFTAALTAVGGHVHLVSGAAEARLRLRDIVSGRAVQRAVLTGHPILYNLELDALLSRMGIEVCAPTTVTAIASAGLGLTGAEYAVAASGTLVMAAAPWHARSASLLPPLHVAVITEEQLLPDLAALADQLKAAFNDHMPSGLALITGPSRTGDIEQTLSVGGHGPEEVYVILLTEMKSQRE